MRGPRLAPAILVAGVVGLSALGPPARAEAAPPGSAAVPAGGRATAIAARTGKHCLDRPERRLLLDHALVGTVNPLGLEHRLRFYGCFPLVRKPGILFDYTHVRVGLLTLVSPTSVLVGPSFQLWPLSILVLKAEVSGMAIWPVPLPGAGYIALPGYAPFNRPLLEPPVTGPGAATSAFGLRVQLGATLQGRVSIGRRLALTATSVFSGDYFRVGAGPYYYNTRMDAIMAASDWIILDTSVLFLSILLRPGYELRLGAVDDLVYVPGNRYLGNAVYGLVALYLDHPGRRAHRLNVFAWLGSYTHHAFRAGELTTTLGLELTWDVSRVQPRR